MTDLRPYPRYAQSGTEWLGSMPASWRVAPLLGYTGESRRRNAGLREQNLLSLSYGRIVRKDINSSDGLLPESFDTYQIVEPDDVVLRLTDLQNDQRSLRTGLVTERGIITSAYLAVSPRGMDARYLAYFLRDVDSRKVFYSLGGGLRQSMQFADLKRLPILVPSREEQTAIADFLDRETAEVDAFIADQEELIRLLTERRAATISHAITKGLDRTAPMVATGLPWPTSVPASWRKCSIRNVFQVLDCKHITADFEPDGEYPLASIREVKGDFVDLRRAKRTNRASFVALAEGGRAPRPGDLIVSRNASVGDVALVPEGLGTFAMGQDVSLIRDSSGQQRTRFLAYALRSKLGLDAFAAASIGSTFKRINVDDIKAVTLWMPVDVDELSAIVEHLRAETSEFDAAIADARETIALSRERRAALISAAVTGKIDVREHAHSRS